MHYWLFKTEPGCFSLNDLIFSPNATTPWDGVRNYQARNLMRSMKIGDLGFFYHSGKQPEIAALVEVVREAYPDHTAQNPQNRHFDPKATPEDPRVFGTSFYAFRSRFFDMTGYGNHIPVFRKSRTEEFLRRLHSVAFRVTKAEALDLPDTTEETRYVELEPDARELYRELARESYSELERGEITASNVLTKILRLSQVTGGYVGDDEKNMHAVSTAKLDALEDILDSVMADGGKLVIMARFVAELDGIVSLLEKRGIGYAQVRGGVRDRAEDVRRLQEKDDCRVFVGQIAAARLGLTLTAADRLVFYSLDTA